MNNDISSLYRFTLQQMAAESYLEGIRLDQSDQVRRALLLGTNREGYRDPNRDLNEGYPGYTRITESQADEFLRTHKIIHQWSDNPSTGAVPGVSPAVVGYAIFDQQGNEVLANSGLSATLIQKGNAQVLHCSNSAQE